MSALFDPGLQPERTALAWRRTALAVTVGAAVGARLLAPALGPAALVAGVLGVAAGVLLLVASGRRGRRTAASLREHGDLSAGPGGADLALTAAGCALAGAVALAALLTRGSP